MNCIELNDYPLCPACAVSNAHNMSPEPFCFIEVIYRAMKKVILYAGTGQSKRAQSRLDGKVKAFFLALSNNPSIITSPAIAMRCLRRAVEHRYPEHLTALDKILVLR